MNKDHSKRRYVIALAVIGGGVVLLVCAVAVFALRSGRRETPLPPVPDATGTPSEMRVKPVVRKDAARAPAVAVSASRAVSVVCGADEATAGRYEARNDALRSIARRRDLPKPSLSSRFTSLVNAILGRGTR